MTAARVDPRGRRRSGGSAPRERREPLDVGELDDAIIGVVRTAEPPVGRTRAVEILRGGRSKVVEKHGYDGLDVYGAFAGLRADDVLGRVDELLAEGTLATTGGRFPKLTVTGA